jgi:hypothetical protein
VCAGQLWVGFHPLSHRLVRGDPAEHPLASGIVGAVEALEQGLEIAWLWIVMPSTSRCTRPLKRSTMPLVFGV